MFLLLLFTRGNYSFTNLPFSLLSAHLSPTIYLSPCIMHHAMHQRHRAEGLWFCPQAAYKIIWGKYEDANIRMYQSSIRFDECHYDIIPKDPGIQGTLEEAS